MPFVFLQSTQDRNKEILKTPAENLPRNFKGATGKKQKLNCDLHYIPCHSFITSVSFYKIVFNQFMILKYLYFNNSPYLLHISESSGELLKLLKPIPRDVDWVCLDWGHILGGPDVQWGDKPCFPTKWHSGQNVTYEAATQTCLTYIKYQKKL